MEVSDIRGRTGKEIIQREDEEKNKTATYMTKLTNKYRKKQYLHQSQEEKSKEEKSQQDIRYHQQQGRKKGRGHADDEFFK